MDILEHFTLNTVPDPDRSRFHDVFRPGKCFTIRMMPQITICFTICLFISPDLDGYRAHRGINPTRPTRSRNPNTKPPHYVHDIARTKRGTVSNTISIRGHLAWVTEFKKRETGGGGGPARRQR